MITADGQHSSILRFVVSLVATLVSARPLDGCSAFAATAKRASSLFAEIITIVEPILYLSVFSVSCCSKRA